MPTHKRYFDRNDLARMLEMSTDQIAGNEDRWGLNETRVHFNDRVVRFHAVPTLVRLRKLGFIIEGTS